MFTVDREALAWASGLFEGEGSVFVATGQRRAELRLATCDEDVVRRFHRVVGTGSVGGPYQHRQRRDNWRPFWTWTAAGHERVQAVVAMLWYGLGVRRRAKAVEVLRVHHGRPLNIGKTSCPRGHAYDVANTYVHPTDGGRRCRACARDYARRVRAARHQPSVSAATAASARILGAAPAATRTA